MLDKITKAVSCAMVPCLDKDFVPATLWDREFRKAVRASGKSKDIVIAVERNPESVSVYPTVVFDNADASEMAANVRHVERLVKGLLWMRGGWKVTIAGDEKIAAELGKIYSPDGERSFDYAMMGRIYSNRMQIVSCAYADAPKAKEPSMPLGRHLDGCRIGFDLGGSDRKCAATIDGKLVFSEEVPWDPYFQKDPQYHRDGINDTLRRAAAHLPRVDAIGGSSAGVYVNNRVRLASLFRGVPEDQFESKVKDLFIELGREWGVPFEVVNDGEVTALAGSMEMNANCVLGISMGTSVADACAAIPSPRPAKPRRSVVVALTLTAAPGSTSARLRTICAMYPWSFGACATIVTSACATRRPASCTRRATSRNRSMEFAPRYLSSVSGYRRPMSPRHAAPSMASISAWTATSASLCPSSPRS